jgi:hypothetical protein
LSDRKLKSLPPEPFRHQDSAIAPTVVIVVLVISPSLENAVFYLGLACVVALMSIGLLAGLYETARQLERFDDYKKEFEERWGPLNENDIKN